MYYLFQRTALHLAIENEQIEIIKLLLSRSDIDINVKDEVFNN